MSEPTEIEAKALQRLAVDENRMAAGPAAKVTGSRRTSQSLGEAWSQFWRHPSPWLIGSFLIGALAYHGTLRTFSWTELIVPVALVVLFPVIEWVIHVVILHWRPRKVGGVPVDSLLARKHRAHHADPRVLPLVFIPWQVELWLLPSYVVIVLLAFQGQAAGCDVPRCRGGPDVQVRVRALPRAQRLPARTRAFRAVWRNHLLHRYKNEHFWFTVTTGGTADRLLGTGPDSKDVQTSKAVRQLHDLEERRVTAPGRR